MRHEVASQRYEVWLKFLGQPHCALQTELVHVGTEVYVGDLGDAEALKGFGQPRQLNINVLGNRVMGFPEKAFNGEPSTGESRQSDD